MTVHQLHPKIKGIGEVIREFAREHRVSLMDACIHYAEANDIEVELVGDLVAQDSSLKADLATEAASLHMLKVKALT